MSSVSYDIFKRDVLDVQIKQITSYGTIKSNFTGRPAKHPYDIIEENFDKYRGQAEKHILSGRLDRHKLASCMCGAIIESKPLIYLNNFKVVETNKPITVCIENSVSK